MKTIHVYVAIAALFLLFTSACSQEKVIPEQESGPQLSESTYLILGQVTTGGFSQTVSEDVLLTIMDSYRGDGDDNSYISASVLKNGSLYMINSEVIHSDGTQGEVWVHLGEVAGDIVFDTVKPGEKIECIGTCDHCQYGEGSICYQCYCNHPFPNGSCEESVITM